MLNAGQAKPNPNPSITLTLTITPFKSFFLKLGNKNLYKERNKLSREPEEVGML